jgi:rubrerythrin
LSIEELEAIRLCDLLQVEQNEAADMMGISRKTFWNDLQKARQKVVDALVNGKAIEISGGDYVNSGECKTEFLCRDCGSIWESLCGAGRPEACPSCSSKSIYRKGGDGRGKRLTESGYRCPKNVTLKEGTKNGSE